MQGITRLIVSKWTIQELILLTLLVVSPFYFHPNIGDTGLLIPNNSFVWLTAVLFISYSLLKLSTSAYIELPSHFYLIALFPILVITSGMVSGIQQPLQWSLKVVYVAGGFLFFFSVLQCRKNRLWWERLLVFISLGGLLHAITGIVQIYTDDALFFFIPYSRLHTPLGYLQQLNIQATFLATVIIINFYLASRPILKKRFTSLEVTLVVVSLLASFVIGYSGSRIGALSLIVSLPLLFVARKKQLQKKINLFLVLIVVVLIGFWGGVKESGSRLADKVEVMQTGYNGETRLTIYNISMKLFSEQPVFGHGFGSFGNVFQNARAEYYSTNEKAKLPSLMVTHPHNETILMMVEGGLIALIGLALVVVCLFIKFRQIGFSRSAAYAAMMAPIFMHTQVELPFYISSFSWFLGLLLLAFPFRHNLNLHANPMSFAATKSVQLFSILFTGLLLVFFVHTMRSNLDISRFYSGVTINEAPLSVARKNPYLASKANIMFMSSGLLNSIEEGKTADTAIYAAWFREQISQYPNPNFYRWLAMAYLSMGENQNCFSISQEGLSIYPEHDELQYYKSLCES